MDSVLHWAPLPFILFKFKKHKTCSFLLRMGRFACLTNQGSMSKHENSDNSRKKTSRQTTILQPFDALIPAPVQPNKSLSSLINAVIHNCSQRKGRNIERIFCCWSKEVLRSHPPLKYFHSPPLYIINYKICCRFLALFLHQFTDDVE